MDSNAHTHEKMDPETIGIKETAEAGTPQARTAGGSSTRRQQSVKHQKNPTKKRKREKKNDEDESEDKNHAFADDIEDLRRMSISLTIKIDSFVKTAEELKARREAKLEDKRLNGECVCHTCFDSNRYEDVYSQMEQWKWYRDNRLKELNAELDGYQGKGKSKDGVEMVESE